MTDAGKGNVAPSETQGREKGRQHATQADQRLERELSVGSGAGRAPCHNMVVAKLLLVVIWMGAISAVAAVAIAIYEVQRTRPSFPQAISIERTPARQNRNPWSRWSLTEHLSAHSILVAHVETEHLDEAVLIAKQLVEPVKERYEEVLIYFHRPGRPDTLPPRRVQWTLKTAYVETVYE